MSKMKLITKKGIIYNTTGVTFLSTKVILQYFDKNDIKRYCMIDISEIDKITTY